MKQQAILVLLLDDNEADARMMMRTLRDMGEVDWVNNQKTFQNKIREKAYDVVCADYRLPGWDGLDALEWLRMAGYATPLILITGSLGEGQEEECMKWGVADFVLKSQMERLPGVIRRVLKIS